ncbi:MAG: hypothetical protein A2756_05400 [Candidatus Ryanbacteria bacterium RIFCSPHIGHO2_01_FULL_48_27]|uniref:Uncharacterized protein n=1 Tax=Candidatus Ryanbacteria bacterium RIFCSPHIGHO2_01_FULL_48_27 TaxID=1802115 RepID=A0A1G2G1U8_9BACT|nr:MAG: hypothetical protein A2756_05400 [Candidatus Ryanbacteria bacterium RIFCSPHIGHO2_01_FULL_48_27]
MIIMNQTTAYKPRLSPIQPRMHPAELAREKALDTQDPEHPIRREIRRLCETFNLSATFSEDTGTLSALKTPGLIAVKCVLSKDGKPLGVGHGTAILTRINKSIERTAFICLNASFLSAANSACKVMDALRLDAHDQATPRGAVEAYRAKPEESSDLASNKQKAYLKQLINLNCAEADAEQWMSQIDDLTKEEASGLIQRFAK